MVNDTTEASGRDSTDAIEFGRAGQENYFSVCELCITGLRHVAKQCVSSRIYMISDRLFGDWYIFNATGSTGSFSQVQGFPLPQNIMFS